MDVPREEGWVTSGGCDIHYFRWGNPANPPLLLMHGFLAHARCFAFIAPFLAEHYHVVAYDLSGMGDSQARESYPDTVRAQEVVDVAEATGTPAYAAGELEASRLKAAQFLLLRVGPFADVWDSDVVPLLERDQDRKLHAKSVLDHLKSEYPGQFSRKHLRTLQRRIRDWRALGIPDSF